MTTCKAQIFGSGNILIKIKIKCPTEENLQIMAHLSLKKPSKVFDKCFKKLN